LAVSIFDNETGDPAFDRWTHSLTDHVVIALTKLAPDRLAVIGNAAPLRRPRNIRNLKVLARELDVDYIVLGQLQKQGEGLRFITHLIELPGETHLKANRLSSRAEDLTMLEVDVGIEFVRAVRVHILKRSLKG
jgi:TolB-like protein